ncbi:MAG TPA: porin family protein [Cyclobacteriaceae bacterium]|nr:porin family protein [Cyclobacteriaceae bacterium]
MKSIIVPIVVLFLFVAGNLFGQISGGARIGANISNLKYSEDNFSEKQESKVGPIIGLYVTYMFAEQAGIQPELFYSLMGAGDPGDEDKTNLSYIALPVMFRYNITEQFHLLAGPQFSFLLSAKEKDPDGDVDLKDETSSIDVGFTIGAGADINKFNVGLRYLFGLSNVADFESIGDFKVKNSAFQIVLGYRLFEGF